MGDFYVDVDSIKKRNGLIYYWKMTDYLEPIGNSYSSTGKRIVDCKKSN